MRTTALVASALAVYVVGTTASDASRHLDPQSDGLGAKQIPREADGPSNVNLHRRFRLRSFAAAQGLSGPQSPPRIQTSSAESPPLNAELLPHLEQAPPEPPQHQEGDSSLLTNEWGNVSASQNSPSPQAPAGDLGVDLGLKPSGIPTNASTLSTLMSSSTGNLGQIQLPVLSSAVQQNLLTRIGETFNVSAPNTSRAGLVTNCEANNTLAYTFDDGPYVWHDQLNNLFTANDAKTTFFVNGNNWGCIYDQANVDALRASYAAGHLIGSHTWGHVHLNQLTMDQIDQHSKMQHLLLE